MRGARADPTWDEPRASTLGARAFASTNHADLEAPKTDRKTGPVRPVFAVDELGEFARSPAKDCSAVHVRMQFGPYEGDGGPDMSGLRLGLL